MMQNETINSQSTQESPGRVKAWAALLLCIFLTWVFMFYVGPWIRDSIPLMKQLTEVAKKRDIDTTAFFYSENKESYEAERYLRETMDLTRPKGYGYNIFFFMGIVFCIMILVVGYFLLPNGTNDNQSHDANTR